MLRNLRQRLEGGPQPQTAEVTKKEEVTMDNLISLDIKGHSEPEQKDQPVSSIGNLIDFTDKEAE